MVRCKICYSTKVQQKEWVEINSGELQGSLDCNEKENIWCPVCEEHVGLIHLTDEDYLHVVVTKALSEFWENIANSYPEIESGDTSPSEIINFENQSKCFVRTWIKNNK